MEIARLGPKPRTSASTMTGTSTNTHLNLHINTGTRYYQYQYQYQYHQWPAFPNQSHLHQHLQLPGRFHIGSAAVAHVIYPLWYGLVGAPSQLAPQSLWQGTHKRCQYNHLWKIKCPVCVSLKVHRHHLPCAHFKTWVTHKTCEQDHDLQAGHR